MPEDVSGRAWLRRAGALRLSQGGVEKAAVTDLCLKRWGQVGGSSEGGANACMSVAVLRVTLHLQCRMRGSVKLQPLRAGCLRAPGSQRQPCGGLCSAFGGCQIYVHTETIGTIIIPNQQGDQHEFLQ